MKVIEELNFDNKENAADVMRPKLGNPRTPIFEQNLHYSYLELLLTLYY